MNAIKRFWFRHYWWITVVLVPLLIVLLITLVADRFYDLLVPCVGAAFSIIFFTQKQKLEEIKLFNDLFTIFNERYDNLNGNISDIKAKDITDRKKINKTLDDYFNLCAEEYLFYKEGRILHSVWGAWCRGMQEHLKDDTIKEYWDEAQKEPSYYGLTTQFIDKGAQNKT